MPGIRHGWLLILAACGSPAAPAPARPAGPTPVTLGETFTIDSKILGERRVINVYLPPDYAKDPSVRYPVLYMPDGGMKEDFPHVVGSVDVSIKNAVIRPVIVVGIENTDRRHDVTPPTRIAEDQKISPRGVGGSKTFRAFFRDELKPAIAARYRTTAESALIGESLAGLFTVETFLDEPALFDSYIAVDPSLWWDDEALARSANEKLADQSSPKRLYMATGDHPFMMAGPEILTTSLRILSPAGITWTYDKMPDEQHNTIFAIAAVRGIRTVFAP